MKLLFKKQLYVALILSFVMIFLTKSVKAQPTFSDKVDIMGITLDTNRNDIKAILEKSYNIIGFSDNKQKFKLNNIETDEIPITLHFEVQDINDKNSSLAADLTELFVISLDPTPNSKAILAVERYYSFPKGRRPLKNVLMQSLIDKYGNLTVNDPVHSNTYYWTNPPVNHNTYIPFAKFANSIAYHGHVVWYEDHINCDQNLCMSSEADDFLNAIRAVADDKTNNLSKCKTLMALSFVQNGGNYINDNDEVIGFSLMLVNLNKSLSSMKALINITANQQQKNQQEDLIKKKQNRAPKL